MSIKNQQESIAGTAAPMTSGYMLSVKVSQFAPFPKDGTQPYFVLTVIPIDGDNPTVNLTYLCGVADITNIVDGYLSLYSDIPTPDPMPTSLPLLDGSYTFAYQKKLDTIIKIMVSAPDAENAATTAPF